MAASAVVLGVGSAIVILVSPERRTPVRARVGGVSATPVVTRAELPRRIPVAYAGSPEQATAESHAA